jgi:phosphoribosylformylglycinamidine cyclo-ligase
MAITYKDAGVDIDAGESLVERIKPMARATMRPEVLGGIGGFAALCRIPAGYADPVLVSGTDGVGTKLKTALAARRHATIGVDLVAMCVNDVLVTGAEPLFFLDYFATGALDVETAAAVIAGIADGCRQAGCALVGGETAELPGLYHGQDYDLAGFCVGVVERSRLVTGERIAEGDAVVGIASSGLHANGYSLVRKVIADAGLDLTSRPSNLAGSLADELLRPTAIYAPALLALAASADLKGLAHVTGGGIPGNLARILPDGVGARLDRGAWPAPPIFGLLAEWGGLAEDDLFATFNMGIGMIAVLPATDADAAVEILDRHGHRAYHIGVIRMRDREAAVRL